MDVGKATNLGGNQTLPVLSCSPAAAFSSDNLFSKRTRVVVIKSYMGRRQNKHAKETELHIKPK